MRDANGKGKTEWDSKKMERLKRDLKTAKKNLHGKKKTHRMFQSKRHFILDLTICKILQRFIDSCKDEKNYVHNVNIEAEHALRAHVYILFSKFYQDVYICICKLYSTDTHLRGT